MKKMQISLNFNGYTEEVFNFYKSVFKTEFKTLLHFTDMPPMDGFPPLPEEVKNMVLHVELPLGENLLLFGSDSPEALGRATTAGTNFAISLEANSKEEADETFVALAAGGKIDMPLAITFWGAYHGSLTDKYGINWTISFENS